MNRAGPRLGIRPASLRLVHAADEAPAGDASAAPPRPVQGGTHGRFAISAHRGPAAASRRAVTQSNVESAYATDLDPQDPRWLVALETASHLEGSLLAFERRERVLAFAARVGVRTFDANLIIAAVQDRARRGEPLEAAAGTISMAALPSSNGVRATRRDGRLYLITALIAVAAHVALGWAILRLAGG